MNVVIKSVRGGVLCSGQSLRDVVAANISRLDGADLRGAVLVRAELRYGSFVEADFSNAGLRGVDLSNSNLAKAQFVEANLNCANLSHANLEDASFLDASLDDADLRYAILEDAFFMGASLKRANLSDTMLHDVEWHGLNLYGANLCNANLTSASLGGADLRSANLRGANLANADLVGANLRDADLRGCSLADAKLSYANLSSTYLSHAEIFPNVPAIPQIHQKMWAIVANAGALDMNNPKPSETVRDRAGWVCMLAGDEGSSLVASMGKNVAASLIYLASDPSMTRVPDWFETTGVALADIKRLASG